MPLTLIIGPRGSAKTYFSTIINKDSKRLIYANYRINLKNYRKLELHELPFLPVDIELILDEGYTLFDSRNSMSYINRYLTYMAFQLRKTNIGIFITAQQMSSIDVRFREEWDYRVQCQRISNGNENWKFWDFVFQITDKRRNQTSSWIILYEDAKEYFFLYDTNEIVQPRNKSRIVYEFISSDPLLLSDYSQKIAKKIKNRIKVLTKDEVEFALKRAGYDKIWKNDVYIELKHGL